MTKLYHTPPRAVKSIILTFSAEGAGAFTGSEFLDEIIGAGENGQNKTASTEETGKRYISMEDYTNSDSPVWNNVDYEDEKAKASITQQVHKDMINSGQIVTLSSRKKSISSKPCLEGFFTTSKGDMNLT